MIARAWYLSCVSPDMANEPVLSSLLPPESHMSLSVNALSHVSLGPATTPGASSLSTVRAPLESSHRVPDARQNTALVPPHETDTVFSPSSTATPAGGGGENAARGESLSWSRATIHPFGAHGVSSLSENDTFRNASFPSSMSNCGSSTRPFERGATCGTASGPRLTGTPSTTSSHEPSSSSAKVKPNRFSSSPSSRTTMFLWTWPTSTSFAETRRIGSTTPLQLNGPSLGCSSQSPP